MSAEQLNVAAAIFDRIEADASLTDVFAWVRETYPDVLSVRDIWDIFDLNKNVVSLADWE
jgi:hypothetical protein